MNEGEIEPDFGWAAEEAEVADETMPDFLIDNRYAMGRHAVLERFQVFRQDPFDSERGLLIAIRYHGDHIESVSEHSLTAEQFQKINDAKSRRDHGQRLIRWWGQVKLDMALQIPTLDGVRQTDAARIEANIRAQNPRRSSRPSRPV